MSSGSSGEGRGSSVDSCAVASSHRLEEFYLLAGRDRDDRLAPAWDHARRAPAAALLLGLDGHHPHAQDVDLELQLDRLLDLVLVREAGNGEGVVVALRLGDALLAD